MFTITTQVIPDDVIDSLLTVCHSNSYEKLQAFIQVRLLVWVIYFAIWLFTDLINIFKKNVKFKFCFVTIFVWPVS